MFACRKKSDSPFRKVFEYLILNWLIRHELLYKYLFSLSYTKAIRGVSVFSWDMGVKILYNIWVL